jgi:ribonuclease P protein component
MSSTLEMLRTPRQFAALQAAPRGRGDRLLAVRCIRNDTSVTRFGISTGRRIGGAVVRNRIRRRFRETLRALQPRIEAGWDVLIVARPASSTAAFGELATALERALRQAGIIGPRVGATPHGPAAAASVAAP